MPKYTLEKIRTLPQPALDNFYSFEVNENYAREVAPLLKEGEPEKLYDLMFDVYFRATTPSAFTSSLSDFIKEEDRRNKIAAHMLGFVFLPIADYLQADIPALIKQIGGDTNIYKKKVAVSDVVEQVKRKAGIETPKDERLAHRLNSIIASRVTEVRKDEQARELLLGPTKTSGAGLDEATTTKILLFANEELAALRQRGIDIVPDEQLKKDEAEEVKAAEAATAAAVAPAPVSEENPEAALEVPVAPVAPKKDTSLTFSSADLKEVEALAKKSQPNQTETATSDEAASLLDGIVDEAISISKVQFTDLDLQKRYRTAVSLYFRDLRDVMETRSKFTMPVVQGGLGLSVPDTDRIMSVLAAKAGEFRELMSSRASASKQRYVELQTKKVLTAEEAMLKREQEELEHRYAELTVNSKKGPAPAAPKPPPGPPKVIPVIAIAKNPPVSPPPPPNLPIMPAPAPTPSMPPKPPPPPEPPKPAVPLAPPPPMPKMTVVPPPMAPSVMPKPVVVAPSMTDVAHTPKLTGPVEELRSMNIKDFRRLSRDPKEATLKIKDKIDLLGEQSFDIKTQGVIAWQASEPNRLYLDLLKRSLEGKPILDLIAEREAKKETVLTKQEFDAIMVLNRTLRFG